MSAVPQQLPQSSAPSLKPGQALIVGRVSEFRRTENGTVLTIIQTPAPDAFSHPGCHEVGSKHVIGKPGEDCRVIVQLTGYRRTYTDKHGERTATVDNRLQAVE